MHSCARTDADARVPLITCTALHLLHLHCVWLCTLFPISIDDVNRTANLVMIVVYHFLMTMVSLNNMNLKRWLFADSFNFIKAGEIWNCLQTISISSTSFCSWENAELALISDKIQKQHYKMCFTTLIIESINATAIL